MGSSVSCIAPHDSPSGNIRVVHPDGRTTIFDKSLTAGEVTKEYPDHLLCDFDSFYIGQKIPALSPADELKMGCRYFLLPEHAFQSVLSFVSLASLVSRPASPGGAPAVPVHKNCVARASLLVSQPFEIQKSAAGGGLQIKVRGEFISKLIEDGKFDDKNCCRGSLCNTPELQKDYAQLVTSRNQIWRPKLDTITERDPIAKSGYRRFKNSIGTKSFRSMNQHRSSMSSD